jgi:murein DD-endopeptidase MepM/ murein hydrolase activator NlpD
MKTKLSSIPVISKDFVKFLRSNQVKSTFALLILSTAFAMFFIGRWSSPAAVLMQQTIGELKFEIVAQQEMLAKLSRDQEIHMDALAVRLAELKAASTRLDALGERLVRLAQLDPEEFDFSQPPPVGGPEKVISNGHVSGVDLSASINRLSRTLDSQFARLDALQLLLLDRNLEDDRTPAGWPVSSGWISSGFGERNDPFTGQRTLHEGLDFAGVKGNDVMGVASGVVTWSGARQGFGKLVEIDHGNGYITRYAHNDELLVKAGDGVTAGQTIARMGATGRASSPHVHFEVLYRNKAVNPRQFVKQIR